jgi:hypothetical protein
VDPKGGLDMMTERKNSSLAMDFDLYFAIFVLDCLGL